MEDGSRTNMEEKMMEHADKTMTFDLQLSRTMSVIRELAQGEVLHLPDGYAIAMGDDMSIGFLFGSDETGWTISGLSSISIKDLNDICNKHDIGHAIPKIKR